MQTISQKKAVAAAVEKVTGSAGAIVQAATQADKARGKLADQVRALFASPVPVIGTTLAAVFEQLAEQLTKKGQIDSEAWGRIANSIATHVRQIWAAIPEEGRLEDGGIHNPIAGTNIASTCRIEDLRALGSSPKQVALLLACNTGFYNTDNPEIFFSRRRFAPAPNFYDLALEGVSA